MYRAVNLNVVDGVSSVEVLLNGSPLGQLSLTVPGAHNIQNALAAVTVGMRLGL